MSYESVLESIHCHFCDWLQPVLIQCCRRLHKCISTKKKRTLGAPLRASYHTDRLSCLKDLHDKWQHFYLTLTEHPLPQNNSEEDIRKKKTKLLLCLLRYNWHTALCKFKLCSVDWYIYILYSICHHRVS